MKKQYIEPIVLQTVIMGSVILSSSSTPESPILPIDPTIDIVEGE